MPVDHADLRKLMVSAKMRSPALGMVTNHVEIERLFGNFITSTQAEISLADVERVSQHYGYNRDFAKRCYSQLKRDKNKLGAQELWSTLSHHLDSIEPDIIKFISDQIAFPHLYRHPSDRKGGKIHKAIDAIVSAQSALPLNGKQESGNDFLVKDLCLSYGKMIFSKKMNIGEWWRGFERLAHFALQSNGFMANFKECCLCLIDFIYKYGSHENVEQKIAQLIIDHVFHYKAYVGNPQSEVFMYVVLAFARKITSKTLSFLLGLLHNKFKEVKSNSKRCEMIAWSIMQMVPAINKIKDEDKQQKAIDVIGKFMSTVFEEWRANNQGPTRHWTALAYYQLKKYDFADRLNINDNAINKAENALSVESWDVDDLTADIFPIFEDIDMDEDNEEKKKKKKKKKRKKGSKETAQERKKREKRRKQQIKIGKDQQYKMYGQNTDWNQMGHSMKSVISTANGFGIQDIIKEEEEHHDIMTELDNKTKEKLDNFKRMQTIEGDGGIFFDPDKDVFDKNDLDDDIKDVEEIDPIQKRKDDEKEKLLSLKQKKFFLMEDQHINYALNPYNIKIKEELTAFKPLIEWDSSMIKEWIKKDLFSLGINDEIDDYFPDYMNGYMFLNLIRFPYDVVRKNLTESRMKWPDKFLSAMWVASKEFHTKYLLELGINCVGECCGQINALKIESHRLSHILQENDIVYDPDYAKQCVTQELIAPKFEEILALSDAVHPRWTDNDAKQLKSLYLRLASRLEKDTLDLIKNESKYYEAQRKTHIDLRELSTRVDLRYNDLENYNTQLTTQELMLRDLAVKSKHLTLEKNQLLNEYAAAVSEKNYYLRELHINGKLPYIEHLEKLKAEIQRQVDDVTLLDYQKDQVNQNEKHWIDLADIIITVFNENADKEQKELEDELKEQFAIENDPQLGPKHKHKKHGKNTPKHRKNRSSSSASASGAKKHRRSGSLSSKKGDEIATFTTIHNREDNIDIVCVIQKMFAHFIAHYHDKQEFLPEFNRMIDELYDVDPTVLHYEPVNLDVTSLKRYVQQGKEAKMAELQRKKQEKEAKEEAKQDALEDKVDALKQSLGQHNVQKGAEAQLKEMEKKVKTQQRRDRNKKLLEKDKTEQKEEEKENEITPPPTPPTDDDDDDNEIETIPPPPPAPFHEKLEEDEKDVVIVPPPPPKPSSFASNTLSIDNKKSRHRYKKSMMDAHQMYATKWAQYKSSQQNYAQQYQMEQQQYRANWIRLQNGQITPQQWQQYQNGFVLKWRQYAYWLQYQQMSASQRFTQSFTQIPQQQIQQQNTPKLNENSELNKLYDIALREFPKNDADLWLQWKQSKQQTLNIGNVGINNIDKMQCLRIDSKVQEIYDIENPSNNDDKIQQEKQEEISREQQQQMYYQNQNQQRLMQQRWSQMNPQQRQYYMMQQQQRVSAIHQQQRVSMQMQQMQQMQQYYRQMSQSNSSLPSMQQQQQQQRVSMVQQQQLYQQQMLQQQQYQHQQQQYQQQARTSMKDMMAQMELPPPPQPSAGLNVPESAPKERYAPSTGNRLRGGLESVDKKKERERRRLERKKRRGLQKLQPSAQQKANEKTNEFDDYDEL